MKEKEYLTVIEVAEKFGVSASLIRKLVFKSEIPFLKIRGLIRFTPKEINKWVEDQQSDFQDEVN